MSSYPRQVASATPIMVREKTPDSLVQLTTDDTRITVDGSSAMASTPITTSANVEPSAVVFHIPPSYAAVGDDHLPTANNTAIQMVEMGAANHNTELVASTSSLPSSNALLATTTTLTSSSYFNGSSTSTSKLNGHNIIQTISHADNKIYAINNSLAPPPRVTDVTLIIPSATPSPTEDSSSSSSITPGDSSIDTPHAAMFAKILDPSVDTDPFDEMRSWDEDVQDAFVKFVHVQQLLELTKKMDGIGSDTLSFSKLGFTHDGIKYLNDLTGVVKPFQITAVVGAPDAGVSLLLNLLAGRKPRDGQMQGRVLFNGKDRTSTDTRAVGYVVKEDPNLPNLTVFETLCFSATTRLKDITPKAARLRTLMLMKLLGLSHTVNTVVGDAITRGVSGGERRRVCFGSEFIAGAKVMIADLPTNGLDSTSAYNLIRNIKTLTAAGRSMICSIVQPSPELFALFDSIIVLSKGHLIYQGPPDQVEQHFKAMGFVKPEFKALPDFIEEVSGTPEKYWVVEAPSKPLSSSSSSSSSRAERTPFQEFMHAIMGKKESIYIAPEETHRGTAWKELVKQYDASWMKAQAEKDLEESIQKPGGAVKGGFLHKHISPQHGRYALEPHRQLWQLFRRQALLQFRTPQIWASNFASSIVIALILGSLFWNIGRTQDNARTRFGLFFFMIMNSAMGAAQMIPVHFSQRITFYNQIRNGYYHPSVYYIAQFVVQIPVALVETFLLSIIVYGMSSLYDGIGPYWLYLWLAMFLVNLVSRAFIMLVVSVSKTETVSQVLHPLAMLLFSTMAGYLNPKNSIPTGWKWVYYVSFITYAIRGISLNEMANDDFVFSCPAPPEGCPIKTGEDALAIYDMDGDLSTRWTDIQNLVWFLLGFIVGGIIMYTAWIWSDTELEEPPNFHDVEVIHINKEASKAALLQLKKKAYMEWKDVDYEVDIKDSKTGKMKPRQLLNKTFGFARPGLMIALMGASGAGKSTLLDVLAMKKTSGRIKGKILLNGLPQDPISFSRLAAYVEQFDSHDEKCTVREAIMFSARLRLPASTTQRELDAKVDNVMAVLNISHLKDERIGNSETGGVSPEVRKKCTIAVELIMEPSILFLDEPTTGLDAPGALSVMTAVRQLASEIGVVCTIHQPSTEIVNMFDYLLLMKEGGEIAYFGPLQDVPTYFADSQLGHYMPGANIGDFALHYIKRSITSGGTNLLGEPVNLAQNFLNSKWGKQVQAIQEQGIVPDESKGKLNVLPESAYPSVGTQFQQLVQRFFLSNLRDAPGLGARFGTAIIQGFVVGTLFVQLGIGQTDGSNRVSLAFMVVLMLVFGGAVKQPAMIAARPVYFRERGSNMYSPLSYYLGRTIADIPYILLEIIAFACMTYFIPGLTTRSGGSHFWLYLLCLLLVRYMALNFNVVTSSVFGNAAAATAAFALSNIIFMLFTGFLISKNNIPDGWIWMYYLSFLRYPVGFVTANELRGISELTCSSSSLITLPLGYSTCALPAGATQKCFTQCGHELLNQFGIDYADSDMYVNIFVVAIFAIGFNVIGFLALKFINHIKR